MQAILEVKGLCKTYPQFALRKVSFSLPAGAVMGFIGANGAGKTTTMKCILGATPHDGGAVSLFGEAFTGRERAPKGRIGVVLDLPFYVEEWKVFEVERALAPFYETWSREAFAASLRRFGLDPQKRVRELSRGMKVKLMLAAALSHGAQLLILDEPTSGLDPVARDELMDILRDFVSDEQHSILFSTHITSDLEKIADYITFLRMGEVLFTGETSALLESYRLIKGGAADLTPALRGVLLGLREHSVGFDALLPVGKLAMLPPQVSQEGVSLEEIMVYLSKEGGR